MNEEQQAQALSDFMRESGRQSHERRIAGQTHHDSEQIGNAIQSLCDHDTRFEKAERRSLRINVALLGATALLVTVTAASLLR